MTAEKLNALQRDILSKTLLFSFHFRFMRNILKYNLLLFFFCCTICSAESVTADKFVSVSGQQFIRGGKPYYYIGTNFWYGPILASKGQGGDRKRLKRELDCMKKIGITNLRILVGAEEGSKNVTSLSPFLLKDGKLNDTLLDGLDYLLRELERRDMTAVLYLTNSWDWSGGFGYYLKQTGHGDSPDASGNGYNDYCRYAAQFYTDAQSQHLYLSHVKKIVSRKNRYTKRAYKDEPSIMAWQLCNEPRPFAAEMFEPMLQWSRNAATLIKSIDPNHLVSTGSEGIIGCLWNADVCQRMHADENIDYLTVHIWPVNWGWASRDRLSEALPNVYIESEKYITENLRIASRLNKPVVIEEFGYPRDRNSYSLNKPTTARDSFYDFIFTKLLECYTQGGGIAGCNFWGWGGSGRPRSERWQPGDDYICDPAHEPQGWYSVFDSDNTTLKLISKYIILLKP